MIQQFETEQGESALLRFVSPEVSAKLQELASIGSQQTAINANGLVQWLALVELSAYALDLIQTAAEQSENPVELALKLDGIQQAIIRKCNETFSFLGQKGVPAALSFLYNSGYVLKEEQKRRARIEDAGRINLLRHMIRQGGL